MNPKNLNSEKEEKMQNPSKEDIDFIKEYFKIDEKNAISLLNANINVGYLKSGLKNKIDSDVDNVKNKVQDRVDDILNDFT